MANEEKTIIFFCIHRQIQANYEAKKVEFGIPDRNALHAYFIFEILSGKVVYFDGKIANLVWRKIEQRILPVEKK